MTVAQGDPGSRIAPTELPVDYLLLIAALVAAGVGQGGYYRRVSDVIGLALIAAFAVLARRRRRDSLAPVRLAVGGVAVLLVCVVLDAARDGHPSSAAGSIGLLVGIAIVMSVTAAQPMTARRQLADVVLGLGVVLGLSGWLGVAFRVQPLGHPDGGLWRAATTITYANAAAAVLGPLALWSVARLTARPGRAPSVASVALLAGLGATLSRAGLAGLVVGLLVLCGLLGVRRMWQAGAPPLVGGAVSLAGLLPGMPASGPSRPEWAVLGLVLGLVVGAVPWTDGRDRTWRRWVGPVVVVGVVGAGAATVAVHTHLWSGRLGAASPDRTSLASVALHTWDTHLVTGAGPGRALFIWAEANHRLVYDRYAHDEYLQLAVEDGLIGLGGLVLVGATAGVTVRRGWRQRGDADGVALRAGAMAGLACFALQSGFDFLWHVPVVPLLAALAVGLAAPLEGATGLYPSTPTKEVSCVERNG